MKISKIYPVLITIIFLVIMFSCSVKNNADPQITEATGVIKRVLPGYADRFILKIIDKEGDKDVFEIEPGNNKIVIRGSSGIAICSGFNFYLKNYCNSSYNWRCGNNLNIKGDLPADFRKIRKVSPYQYRYIFNYCTFSYSMSFWDWEQWERMIDWMAMNGINMPLAPMGQEIIWQRVYKKYGVSEEELKDFFVGPAYNAFGRMGCIDGFGGPLPQSWIENENILQKKILSRERQLGMTPVLQGFTGHIPPSLVKHNPGLKFSNLTWLDFPATYLLDWEDPLFGRIAKDFIAEQTKEYGTDHLYAIDQFIEMQPATGDTAYLRNMSSRIFSAIDQADPEGKWVIQTWPFKELDFWNQERTKAYLDGVPDKRMIALELMGESWKLTGWYKHDGWYGKPWVWSIISNFGDNVSMFGGLTHITENFKKALSDPGKGDLAGMGLMMEGLDYNPVTYELVTEFLALSHKLEDLMGTREEFLFGKWIEDSKKLASTPKEAELYEWNARAIITTWGGRILYGYAIKDWSGLYSSYYLPRWEKFFAEMRAEIRDGKELDYEKFTKDIMKWEDNWITLREEKPVSLPTGNSVALAKELWDQYGVKLLNHK